jgi:hypothetical protein
VHNIATRLCQNVPSKPGGAGSSPTGRHFLLAFSTGSQRNRDGRSSRAPLLFGARAASLFFDGLADPVNDTEP